MVDGERGRRILKTGQSNNSHEKIISNLGRNASKLNGFVYKSTIQFYIITLVW